MVPRGVATLLAVALLASRAEVCSAQALSVGALSAAATTEAGNGAVTFTVKLTTQPTHEVTIDFSSSDDTEGVVTPAQIVVLPSFFNLAQPVTVTGQDDFTDDGDVTYSVNIVTQSVDTDYNALTQAVAVTNTDNDAKGVTFVATTAATTTEAKGTASFTAVLNSQPFGMGPAVVTLNFASSKVAEGTVSPASLTFTEANWDAPQPVLVTGVDDDVDDGDVAFQVTPTITATGTDYDTLAVTALDFTNTDDDTAALVLVPTAGTTTEAGGTQEIAVAPATKPVANLVLTVVSSATAEGVVDLATLTFTAANWKTAQTVTVTGQDDKVDDGDVVYDLTFTVNAGDTAYRGKTAKATLTNVDDDTAGVTVTPTTGLSTSEDGTTEKATYTVVLQSKPLQTVVYTLVSTNLKEATVAPATLTFTTTTWDSAQTVTVTGVDDSVDDGDVVVTITSTVATTDTTGYAAIVPAVVSVTNKDDDTAGIDVSPTTGLVTTEAQQTASFWIVLHSQPVEPVTIPLLSLNTAEGTINKASVIFTPTDWNERQEVVVTGVDDEVADGDVAYSISLRPAVSADPLYTALASSSVAALNTDDDEAKVVVTSKVTTTSEDGTAHTFSVVLHSRPTDTVNIALHSTDETEGVVSPTTLSFAPGAWSTPLTVTLTGVDDDVDDGDVAYSVTFATVSIDANYNGIVTPALAFTNLDDDATGVVVSPAAGLTTSEGQDTATFTLVLSSKPEGTGASLVTVPLSTDDTEGSLSAISVVFTSGNWNVPQSITVTGVDDAIQDGNVQYRVVTGPAVSTDVRYNGFDAEDVVLTNSDNDTNGLTISPTVGATTEAGGVQTFGLRLNTKPAADVVFSVATSLDTEGKCDLATLTFTPANWDKAQTVTVTGQDDKVDDGDVAYSVTCTATTASAADYVGMTAKIELTNADNDAAGVAAVGGVTAVTEAGSTGSFTLVLESEPTTNVAYFIESSDETEGKASPDSVVFTAANWMTAQTVSVTGQDDSVVDGTVPYIVNYKVSTRDAKYATLSGSVAFTTTDDDTAGVTVSKTAVTVNEAGKTTATFTVVPTSEVATLLVQALSTDATESSVEPETLVFTAATWATPQTVTVTGVDDDVDDGDVAHSIALRIASTTDAAYRTVDPPDVGVTTTDDDARGFTVFPTDGLKTYEERGGATASFVLVLTSRPEGDVTVTFPTYAEVSLTPSGLVFLKAAWNTPQTVKVSGLDDSADDGDQTVVLTAATVVSSDGMYNGLTPASVTVVNVDDDTAAVTVTAAAGLVTSEAGANAVFAVALASKPSSDVLVPIVSSDTTEGSVSSAQLAFTPATWSVPQTVTVQGLDDAEDDGDVGFSVTVGRCTTIDPLYAALTQQTVPVVNHDDDAVGVRVSSLTGATSEGSAAAEFKVRLSSKPAASVVISVASSDATEGTTSVDSLTFTTANYNVDQTVVVTGVDDKVADGAQAYIVTLGRPASTDAKYAALPLTDVSLTNADDDTAGVVVTPTTGLLITAKPDGSATFTVVLSSQPTAPVSVPAVSADATEGVTAPAELDFTTSNWNVPQTVTVSGVDDAVDDGNVAFFVNVGPPVSTDAVYAAFARTRVSVTSVDDDTAGFTLSNYNGRLVTTEGGDTDSFFLALNSEPKAAVSIGMESSNTLEGTISPVILRFTAQDWAVGQRVTVTGRDDFVADGDAAFSIVLKAAVSSDPSYHSVLPPSVDVTNKDNDVAGFSVAYASDLQTTEAGGTASCTVKLTSEPTAEVVLVLSGVDETEGTAMPTRLVFTTTNWALPQTVTVTGVDDSVDDGDVAYALTLAVATTTDAKYAALPAQTLPVTNVDDDTVGYLVSPTSGLVTKEAGGPAVEVVLQLQSEPTGNVVLALASSHPAEGALAAGQETLTFTPAAWSTPQTLRISGVDDFVADGDVAYTVSIDASRSLDLAYAKLAPPQLSCTNVDNDVKQIVVNHAPNLTTTEAGSVVHFTVVLASEPLSQVSIPVTSSDPTEGEPSTSSLAFTPSNWNVPQTVTVTGVNDAVADGDVSFAAALGVASAYYGIDGPDVQVTNIDDDAVGITVDAQNRAVAEDGGTVRVTVALTSEPAHPVSIQVSTNDTTEATATPASLVFSQATWNVPQTVTVTGVNDEVADGNTPFLVALAPAVSLDAKYSGLDAQDVDMSCVDDDVSSVLLTAVSATLDTTEAGGSVELSLRLSSKPTADVVLPVSTSLATEATVGVGSVTFTPVNWNVLQYVTVRGVDDAVDDGDVAVTFTAGPAATSDAAYASMAAVPFQFRNTDDDAAGVTVAPTSGLSTTEAGATATFTIVLDSQPLQHVVASLTSSDVSEGTVSPERIEFTATNWATPLTVTVTGQPDSVDDGSVEFSIDVAPLASGDPAYHGSVVPRVTVVNEALHCSQHVCPATSTPKVTNCVGTACTDDRCCTPSCAAYTCAAPLRLVAASATTSCPAGPCTDAVCCEEPCATFTCPVATLAIPDAVCVPGACAADACCGPSCATFTCAAGTALKAGSETVACPTGGCTTDCCQPTCASHVCQAPKHVAKPGSADAVLCGAACTDALCCDGTCASFACVLPLTNKAGGGTLICAAGQPACDAARCCEDKCAGVTCTAAGQCRETPLCDAATGACATGATKPDMTVCNDGSDTTIDDVCVKGVCVGGVLCGATVCVPAEPGCKESVCGAGGMGCAEQAKADNSPCDDKNAATVTDVCQAGVCVGSYPMCSTYDPALCTLRSDAAAVVCLVAGCDKATCCETCAAYAAASCPSKQVTAAPCAAGGCAAAECCLDLCAAVVCTASDTCHRAGVCDPAVGICSDARAPDGVACDDGNAETVGDTCVGGTCSGVCTVNGCRAAHPKCNRPVCTGACGEVALTDGSACNDENLLTLTDHCSGGVCVGALVTCATAPVAASCLLVSGAASIVCSAGCAKELCCVTCVSYTGTCPSGTVLNGREFCPASGCSQAACCAPDKCVGVTCPEEGQCTAAGVCEPLTGVCASAPKADGLGCNDGNAGTTGDQCAAGACKGVPTATQFGAQVVVDRSFFSLASSRASVTAFLAAVQTHLATRVPLSGSVGIHSMCAASPAGRRDVSTCIPGSAVAHLSDTSGSSSTGYTFVHLSFAVLASSADASRAAVTELLVPGTVVGGEYTILKPALTVEVGRCALVYCEAPNACTSSTCEAATGRCVEEALPTGAACEDGDPNTSSDSCGGGTCVGEVHCSGTPCKATSPQCYVPACTVTGTCTQAMRADGTPCSDGNADTVDDRCRSGVCKGRSLCDSVVCDSPGACKEPAACDPATGRCSRASTPDGTLCDDGDGSTGGDRCAAGSCVGHVFCGGATCFPTESQCHTAACEGNVCAQQTKEEWTPCDDGQDSTTNDHCVSGVCTGVDKCAGVQCEAPDQCHDLGHCVPERGECTRPVKQDGFPCDDGDSSTNGDKCVRGACVGSVVCGGKTCSVQDTQCRTAVCGSLGECIDVAKPDGTSCTDFDDATIEDRCVKGSCTGTNICANVVCTPVDSCHTAGVCVPALGICTEPPKPHGAQCDDGVALTSGDKCINGVCVGSISCGGKVCMPNLLECNVAVCQNGHCVQVPRVGSCSDGDIATFDDRCSNGICAGVNRCHGVTCRASDSCHVAGVCDPSTGLCSDPVSADGSLCDDRSGNTRSDRCVSGVCVGEVHCGGKLCMPKLSKCMQALCQGDLCREIPKTDGTACNDDDVATSGDKCVSGICIGVLSCGGSACVPSDPQCHTVVCESNRCLQVLKPHGTQCNDGDGYTGDDRCYSGVCKGSNKCQGVVCAPSDGCHTQGTCDELTGLCSDALQADGTPCDDFDAGTADDRCVSGVCVGKFSCGGLSCLPLNPVCHTATCTNNQCTQLLKPSGTACNDGNSSTTADVCGAGSCKGVDLCKDVVCTASDYCHAVGRCQPLTGLCSDPLKADGSICDDGLGTTSDDRCVGGACSGHLMCRGVKCSAGSSPCKEPACESGKCVRNNKPDGTTCNDGNSETGSDRCVRGVCVGTARCAGVVCAALSSCHSVGTCNAATGVCTQPRKPAGVACDIGAQKDAGVCQQGSCVAPVECNGEACRVEDPQCHVASCAASGCVVIRKADGTACDDGDQRTAGDRCAAGGCAGTVPCGAEVCAASEARCHVPRCGASRVCEDVAKPDGTACDDGDAKTTDDVCTAGACAGVDKCSGLVCRSEDECTAARCDLRTGACVNSAQPDGHSCDDGRADTQSDACKSGVCVGAVACGGISCPVRQLPCMVPRCSAGLCDWTPKADDTACDDGDAATQGDSCQKGVCVGRLACGGQACAPQKPACSRIVCLGDQCFERNKPDGSPCDDGDKLTANDACSAGECKGINLCLAVTCAASDNCHAAGACIPHLGLCTDPRMVDGAACSDGIVSTVSDTCAKGSCAGTVSCGGVACKAADPRCTVGLCAHGKCLQEPKKDGTPCNDDDVTTLNDRCTGGRCSGDAKCGGVTCPASDQCHTDGTCVAETGLCEDPPKPDGEPCDDGDPATNADQCVSGVCTGRVQCGRTLCTPTRPQCQTAACSSSGQCIEVVKPNGVFCNDANSSTVSDQCVAGACVGVVSHCVPNLCGSSQNCLSGGGVDQQYTCTCKPPLVGTAVNRSAACTAAHTGCLGSPNYCEVLGQVCANSTVSGFLCVCPPPLRGAAAAAKAECVTGDEASKTLPLVMRKVEGAGEKKERQQVAVDVAELLGVDPSRVLMEEDANTGDLRVSFHGPPRQSGTLRLNHLAPEELMKELLYRTSACSTLNTTFCTTTGVAGVQLAAAACDVLSVSTLCEEKDGCSWDGGCAAEGDDDWFSLWHLFWMIPAGLLVLALLALLVYMCCRGKKTDAYAATPAEEDATANTKYENGVDEIQEGDLASPVSEEEGVNASQLVFQRTAESAPKTPPLTHYGAPSELNPLSYYDARGPSFAPTKSGDGGAYNPDRVCSFFRLFLSSCHPVPYTLRQLSWRDNDYRASLTSMSPDPQWHAMQQPVVPPSDERHPSRSYAHHSAYHASPPPVYTPPPPEPVHGSGRGQLPPPPPPTVSFSPNRAGLYPVKC